MWQYEENDLSNATIREVESSENLQERKAKAAKQGLFSQFELDRGDIVFLDAYDGLIYEEFCLAVEVVKEIKKTRPHVRAAVLQVGISPYLARIDVGKTGSQCYKNWKEKISLGENTIK